MGDKGLLDLAEVLAQLGQEFRKASSVQDPTIQWYGATVELESVITKDADGKVQFWVVEAGGSIASQRTVKVTVNLNPFGGEPRAVGM